MQTIEIQDGVQVNLAKILKGINQLDAKSLDKFAREVNNLVKRKKSKHPMSREAELIKQINSILPASVKREEKRLYSKMKQGTITEKEHEELLFLLDYMETKAAERIHLMGELAALRGISLTELSNQLNTTD